MVSKSKASTSQQTQQYDNRIAATDQAIVARDGSTISVLDAGAIDAAKELGITALTSNETIAREAIANARTLGTGSLTAIAQNADKAFEFVDKQRQDSESRTVQMVIPWLMGGASIVAIALAWKGR